MRPIIYCYTLALVLSLSPLAQAADLTSPSYQITTADTPAGGGSAASPNYSAKTSAVGNAIDLATGSSSPGYRLKTALTAKAAHYRSTLPSGDIDGDGSVTLIDALQALQISVGSVAATSEQLKRGDVAPFIAGRPVPDGVITVADALIILRKVIGLVNW